MLNAAAVTIDNNCLETRRIPVGRIFRDTQNAHASNGCKLEDMMQLDTVQESQAEKSTGNFELLMQLHMNMGDFSADWGHCDRVATYVARMVSHNRADSLQYANLFSTALNELLETAFRNHSKDLHTQEGQIACAVLRAGAIDRIELSIPCDAPLKAFYTDAVEFLGRADFAESYVSALLNDGPLDPRIGLLELAVDYHARLSLQERSASIVCLVAEITLDTPVAVQGN